MASAFAGTAYWSSSDMFTLTRSPSGTMSSTVPTAIPRMRTLDPG